MLTLIIYVMREINKYFLNGQEINKLENKCLNIYIIKQIKL